MQRCVKTFYQLHNFIKYKITIYCLIFLILVLNLNISKIHFYLEIDMRVFEKTCACI